MDRPIDKKNIQRTANLYNERYSELGRNIKTVGWGSQNDQTLRFDMLFRSLDPTGKTILDVGCGLGDMVPYLKERTNGNFNYIGLDIADKLIADAQNTYGSKEVKFLTGDLFDQDLPDVDIAVLSGALSFKIEDIEAYAMATIDRMHALSREAVSLNFLTKYVDFELEKNQHYEPEKLFAKAKSLTRWVSLYHDYRLYEFTIQMKKNI